MAEWEGATIPAKCNECGRAHFVSKPEFATDPDSVCRDCWEAFDGAEIDDLIRASVPQPEIPTSEP